MTNYVWYPVTGNGTSSATGYTWDGTAANWNTGSWIVGPSLGTVNLFGAAITIGSVPGSGTGNSNGTLDNVGLVAGNINPIFLHPPFYTPNGAGNPFINSNNYPVDLLINTGTVSINGLLLGGFNQAATVAQFPTIDVEGADFKVGGSIVNNLTVVFPGGIGTQSATGGGTIDIGTGGTVEAAGTVQPSIAMTFKDGVNDLLSLGLVSSAQPGAFAGSIVGFASGDTILLPAIPFNPANIETFLANTMTISNGTTTLATLPMTGLYTTSSFQLLNSGGNTAIVTCFAAGTRIATERGHVVVEDLREGDLVHTVLGKQTMPIAWIGHRHVDCARHPKPATVWPVRISAGAFGPGQPCRDLLLSPDHALFIYGVLIPVKYLINGDSIAQVPMDSVTYYHVELGHHDVVLAEGLPVESYLDAGDRCNFDLTDEMIRLHPDFEGRLGAAGIWATLGAAPLVVTGPELAAARQAIADCAPAHDVRTMAS